MPSAERMPNSAVVLTFVTVRRARASAARAKGRIASKAARIRLSLESEASALTNVASLTIRPPERRFSEEGWRTRVAEVREAGSNFVYRLAIGRGRTASLASRRARRCKRTQADPKQEADHPKFADAGGDRKESDPSAGVRCQYADVRKRHVSDPADDQNPTERAMSEVRPPDEPAHRNQPQAEENVRNFPHAAAEQDQ